MVVQWTNGEAWFDRYYKSRAYSLAFGNTMGFEINSTVEQDAHPYLFQLTTHAIKNAAIYIFCKSLTFR